MKNGRTEDPDTLSGRPAERPLARLLKAVVALRSVLALVLILVVFSVSTPAFLTANNLTILTKHVAITGLLAVGTALVIIAGGIDLSVGSIAGLAGMIAGYLIDRGLQFGGGQPHYLAAPAVILIALFAGGAVGWINGVLVTKLSIAPFIATLGTLYLCRGVAMLISNGHTFPDLAGDPLRHNTGLPWVGQGTFLFIPIPVWFMALVALAVWVAAARTPFGRHVYAVGGNERAALLCGIHVGRVKIVTFIISGVCAALVGLVIAAQLESAHPATGQSFELNAIAAVVLGGTSLMGGRGTIGGCLIGAFVIGVLADGLVMLGVSEFWQMVIKGAVIILAVGLDRFQLALSGSEAGAER